MGVAPGYGIMKDARACRARPRRARAALGRAARSRATHSEVGSPRADLAGEVGEQAVHRDVLELLARAVPQADRTRRPLALARDDHVGHLAHLGVPDAIAELLVAIVELGPHAGRPEPLVHSAGVVEVLLADRQDAGLDGRQPGREGAGVVLGEDAYEALE